MKCRNLLPSIIIKTKKLKLLHSLPIANHRYRQNSARGTMHRDIYSLYVRNPAPWKPHFHRNHCRIHIQPPWFASDGHFALFSLFLCYLLFPDILFRDMKTIFLCDAVSLFCLITSVRRCEQWKAVWGGVRRCDCVTLGEMFQKDFYLRACFIVLWWYFTLECVR